MQTARSAWFPHLIGEEAAKNRKKLFKEIYYYRYVYVMLMPSLIFLFMFRYMPIYGLQLAFKDFQMNLGIFGSPWIGFDHFRRMMYEPEFFTAFRNTIIISLYRIFWGFPFPIILAILINEVRLRKYKRFVQTVFTFPHFISWIVLSGIILNLFGDSGAIRKLVMEFNPEMATHWNILFNSNIFRSLLVSTDIWKSAGWGAIIYLAAIAGVSPDLYESAAIDGANRLHRMIYITLPGIMPIILIQFLLRIGFIMDGGFDQVFNLYSAPVFSVADTIPTYIYRITFQRGIALDFGFSAAVGLFSNVINFVLLLSANNITKRLGGEGIM